MAMLADQTFDILHPSSSLGWEKLPSLPVGMINALSVVLNETLYVGGGTTRERSWKAGAKLYSIKPGVDSTWTVTDTPTFSYALIVHDSELLLVGGVEYRSVEVTNKIFAMRNGKFIEVLPRMNEKRESPSAVSSGSALVVAGGYSTRDLSSVEVFTDGQWTTAPSLPSAGSNMKPALHGDQWYLVQSNKNVLRASLQSLISGTNLLSWETLPDAPSDFSATAFFGGHLLSIGGGNYNNLTAAIHAFSCSTQSWEHVADLPVRLREVSAVLLPTGEIIVFGGRRMHYSTEVFKAILKAPLVDSDVRINIPKLHQLRKYGINLMELLSKDYQRFYSTSGVQLLAKDRKKAPTLSPGDYVELIFNAWKKSKQPTYPPTWESLLTVLRKMDLGHVAEQITKCMTGSLPEIEDSPQPSKSEFQLSPGDKEQDLLGEESSELRTAVHVRHLQLRYDSLEAKLDQLTDKYDKLLVEVKLLRNTHGSSPLNHAHVPSQEIQPSLLSVEQSHTSLTLSFVTPPPLPHWSTQLQQCSRTGSLRSIEYPAITLDQLVSRVGIDKDLLDKECSNGHLRRMSSLLPDWLTYAKALGFTEPETRDIIDNPQLLNSTHAMKALRVLEKWHRRHAFNATYHHLIKVCLGLSDAAIAVEICKMVKEDIPHAEDSSRPHPLTGEKREATEYTEQGPPKIPRLEEQ